MLLPIIDTRFLGLVSFHAAREMQNDLVSARVRGDAGNTVLLCEHPPTLSLGLRTRPGDLIDSESEWRSRNVEIVCVDRGGGPTYHGPGQLLVYPVVSLRGIGVKRFVATMLSAFADVVREYGVKSELKLDEVGLWVERCGESWKLGSVGLRITRGVTNHGFSLNVSGDLAPYSRFHPCGRSGLRVTTIEELSSSQAPALSEIAARLSDRLASA